MNLLFEGLIAVMKSTQWCSGISPGNTQGPYSMVEVELRLATYKPNAVSGQDLLFLLLAHTTILRLILGSALRDDS